MNIRIFARPLQFIVCGAGLLLLFSHSSYGQAVRRDTTRSDWVTGGSFGPSFPAGNFSRISNVGLHSNTFTEWYVSRHLWLRGMVDFSTYGFESRFTQNDFTLTQNGNRTLIMVLVDVGYRRRLGKWTPAVFVGNGLAFYTEPVLTANIISRQIASVRRTDFYYALHAGVVLEYALNPNFKPFFELSTTFFPGADVSGTRFVVLQPSLGVKVPLKGIVNSVFKRKKP